MMSNRSAVADRLLENDPTLVKLDLSSSLRITDYEAFRQAMLSNHTVQKVVVDFQWLEEYLPQTEYLLLLATVGRMQGLEKLMIFDHGRNSIPMAALASAMRPASHLKALDVVRLEFSSKQDVTLFAQVMAEHESLERFSSHRLTLASGVTLDELFRTLRALPNLRAVCLSFDWDLRTSYVQDAQSLVTLCQSQSLQELKLWSRQLDDSCCIAIAQALRVNTTLKTLDLQCQIIGNQGIEEITAMMEQNYTIESVRTTGRRMSLSNKIDMYVRLNRAGRVILVNADATKKDWVKVLIEGREDIDAIFYFIRSNPTILDME
ncbi:expressed unknown protein [Seminavis robusta]|uniref:Uncharacterized protein n=1 Tax=Seminavis robusta TaxID=568900 RepID=A0A9N8EFH9_9STRA|nr:expressed unknown protein [Seminavis robusta]|eukprot:Sro861_g212280.1 n/a (320) ;mRNA; f:27118-28077